MRVTLSNFKFSVGEKLNFPMLIPTTNTALTVWEHIYYIIINDSLLFCCGMENIHGLKCLKPFFTLKNFQIHILRIHI